MSRRAMPSMPGSRRNAGESPRRCRRRPAPPWHPSVTRLVTSAIDPLRRGADRRATDRHGRRWRPGHGRAASPRRIYHRPGRSDLGGVRHAGGTDPAGRRLGGRSLGPDRRSADGPGAPEDGAARKGHAMPLVRATDTRAAPIPASHPAGPERLVAALRQGAPAERLPPPAAWQMTRGPRPTWPGALAMRPTQRARCDPDHADRAPDTGGGGRSGWRRSEDAALRNAVMEALQTLGASPSTADAAVRDSRPQPARLCATTLAAQIDHPRAAETAIGQVVRSDPKSMSRRRDGDLAASGGSGMAEDLPRCGPLSRRFVPSSMAVRAALRKIGWGNDGARQPAGRTFARAFRRRIPRFAEFF